MSLNSSHRNTRLALLLTLLPTLGLACVDAGAPQVAAPTTAATTTTTTTSRTAASQAGGTLDVRRAVLMQGFHWKSHASVPRWWNVVAAQAADLGAAGIDLVWLPPSGQAASDEGYLPVCWYNQESMYGSRAELQGAIDALHGAGVRVVADLVLNHRVGQRTGGADFTCAPLWGGEAVAADDECNCGRGGRDSGELYGPARDLDHGQDFVRRDVIAWLNWLKSDLGYDGWRYDMVKGYAAWPVGAYDTATAPVFSVAELWDGNRQTLMDWVDATGQTTSVFDFPTMYVLKTAVRDGRYGGLRDASGAPAGMIGRWPARAVTFVDNHDMGPQPYGHAEGQLPFPGDRVMQGYAYILTHPGVPTIWWPHFYSWGLHDEIRTLIQLRKAQGINAESAVAIQVADDSRYAAIIDGRVAMKIGPGDWSPGSGWIVAASGNQYAVWVRPEQETGSEVRTVIFIEQQTAPGQSVHLRGGHDGQLVSAGLFLGPDEPIRYSNLANPENAGAKRADTTLDWNSDSWLDWTCAPGSCAWHEGQGIDYASDGVGVDPENTRGPHWWKFDVMMAGQPGDWFEFKAFLRQGDDARWEPDLHQPGTPRATGNHWAKKGAITFVRFGQSEAEFQDLPR